MNLLPKLKRDTVSRIHSLALLIMTTVMAALTLNGCIFNYFNTCETNDHCPVPDQCVGTFCYSPVDYGFTACATDADCGGLGCYNGYCNVSGVGDGDGDIVGDGDGVTCSDHEDCAADAWCGFNGACVTGAGNVLKPESFWDEHPVTTVADLDLLASVNVVAGDLFIGTDYSGDVTGSIDQATLSFPNLQVVVGELKVIGQRDSVTLDFPALTKVGGDINITENELRNLNFPSLVEIGTADSPGEFNTATNRLLSSIDLRALTLADELDIEAGDPEGDGAQFPDPFSLRAESLQEVSYLWLDGNDAVMGELSVAPHTVGWLELSEVNNVDINPILANLTTLTDQARLRYIEGVAAIGFPLLTTAGSIQLVSSSPTEISAPQLTTLAEDLDIGSNSSLLAIELPALTSVGNELSIENNPLLATIELGALSDVGAALSVRNNDALDNCVATALATASGLPPADISISGNLDNASCP